MGSQGPIIICLAVFFVFLLALVWWREYRSQKATEEYEKQVAKEEAKFKRQVKSLVKQRERQVCIYCFIFISLAYCCECDSRKYLENYDY